jgi:hypothetical protein
MNEVTITQDRLLPDRLSTRRILFFRTLKNLMWPVKEKTNVTQNCIICFWSTSLRLKAKGDHPLSETLNLDN